MTNDRQGEIFIKYRCRYSFGGDEWYLEISAFSMTDARRRLWAVGTNGRVDGPVLEAVNGPGWLGKARDWCRRQLGL